MEEFIEHYIKTIDRFIDHYEKNKYSCDKMMYNIDVFQENTAYLVSNLIRMKQEGEKQQ